MKASSAIVVLFVAALNRHTHTGRERVLVPFQFLQSLCFSEIIVEIGKKLLLAELKRRGKIPYTASVAWTRATSGKTKITNGI